MKPFMDENFMLSTPTARALYHDAAEHMPIYDYHCHLPVREIAENTSFDNIGRLMLGGDHYKWRAMAAFGIPDELIRGSGSDHDKFLAYARMMPYALGNPLYHWTHLELKRVFGIDEPLCEKSAERIWDQANALLARKDFRARGLIEKFDVRLLCTTDDPIDSLEYHQQIAVDPSFKVKVLPAFRPDKAIHLEKPGFAQYIEKLSAAAGRSVERPRDVLDALESRVEFFHAMGARIADHGLDATFYADVDEKKAAKAFEKAMRGESVSEKNAAHYKTYILTALGAIYAKHGWTQQYHVNAIRNNRTAIFKQYGPDAGCDSVYDAPVARNLSGLLDAQDRAGYLPKTILYTLNPAFNYVLASMAGNFQTGEAGKIQFGSAWWFCDQRDGMVDQMKTLSAIGLISEFVGMVTDSRSFVSYPRHEYFRRILCDVIGAWVENGEYPDDMETLQQIVRGICFDNARKYFGIPLN